jgi:2-oxoglutarate ferredoxin oxidoreductase subunit alpha
MDTDVKEFIDKHPFLWVVEQNRDAQVASILRLECPEHAVRIQSILHYSGLPIDAMSIADGVIEGRKARS